MYVFLYKCLLSFIIIKTFQYCIKYNDNILDKLNKIKNLYDTGVLNEEEFKKAKEKILN